MLVTNPQLRAPLPDLLNHPWMTRGFDGPPDHHLIRREPLRADELDRQVIRGMTGFEFGTEDEIERRLVAILESEAYRRAVQYWETKRYWLGDWPQIWGKSLPNLLTVEWDGTGGQGGENKVEAASTPRKNKRFSGFDFYRRKLFSPSTSPPSSPLADINQKEPPDPTRGYHPLISMYYLAREKMERTLDLPLQISDGLRNVSSTNDSLSSSLDMIRPSVSHENPQRSPYQPPTLPLQRNYDLRNVSSTTIVYHGNLPYPSSTTLQSNGSVYNASFMTSPSCDSFF